MNCAGCSVALPDDSKFCPHCGYAIPWDPSLRTPEHISLDLPPVPVSTQLPPFFAVPLWKLSLMSVVTFGLYEFFWFLRNWQRVRDRDEPDIMPFWRAFFGVIFCHACFERIEEYGLAKGMTPGPPILLLTILWIVFTLTWRLPNPFWAMSMLSFIFMLPMQAYANKINNESVPRHDRNARLTVWNWVGIVIGGCLLLLNFLALFLPSK
jgi:hypothetical protein